MAIVTGFVERRGRARVSIDGEFWAELDASVAFERGLSKGTEIPFDDLMEVRVAGERPLAMTRALNVLGYRARSEGEMREKLLRAGYAGGTIEIVIERLRELGYLDDEEFARTAAQEKARKYGPRRILIDLKRSGVDDEVALGAVEEEFSGGDEMEAASRAAQRRYNTAERSDALARRVYGFLARRGYSVGVCAEIAKGYREGGAWE